MEQSKTIRDTAAAAAVVGVDPRTLANWRSQKVGPDYIKVGARVIYRQTDLEKFLESRIVRCFRD